MDKTDDKKSLFMQELQKMELKIVDLYQIFGIQKPEGAVGMLTCYVQPTSEKISPRRLRPGILIIPGGGYNHVSAREGEPVALRFLARGYCAFVLEYSVAPRRFPTQLREAAMAMRYIRENAAAFGVAADGIAATGFSAGGHLCGTLGTMFDCPEVRDIGAPEQLRPDALGLCYPVAVSWGNTHEGSFRCLCGEDAALWQRLSLDALVRPDMPPVFLWHTRSDETVPVRNSLILAEKIDAAGVEFAMHIYRQGNHGLSTADEQAHPVGQVPPVSWDVPGWLEAEVRFFEEIGIKSRDYEVSL